MKIMSEEIGSMQNTVIHYLINSYRKYKNKVAIVCNGQTTTYEELYKKTLKVAEKINEGTGGGVSRYGQKAYNRNDEKFR